MAHELGLGRQLARHRGALLAGQEPRRLLPLVRSPGAGRPADVAPGTRAAERLHLRKAVVAARAPGSATVRSAPLSVGRVAPPDNGAHYRQSRALVRGHARVTIRGAPADARERGLP